MREKVMARVAGLGKREVAWVVTGCEKKGKEGGFV